MDKFFEILWMICIWGSVAWYILFVGLTAVFGVKDIKVMIRDLQAQLDSEKK